MTGPLRGAPTPEGARNLAAVRAIARVMDTAVRIPGTDIRLGLDALLGLVPGVGDVAGGAISGYVILAAWRSGAPTSVLVRMLANVGIDTLVGTVPVLGDLFDVAFRANQRNAALLERHVADPRGTRRSSRAAMVLIVVALVLLVAGAVAVATALVRWVLGQFG